MSTKRSHLVWIDLEMTGLNPNHDRIIEIATVVTDSNLNILDEGPVFAISQPQALLDGMDDWNQKQHGHSGLIKRVQDSVVTEAFAEQETIRFLKQYVKKGQSPMCGNSIWQDRRFLGKYMPDLEQFFHYRLLDVSTLKELAKRWKPKVYNALDKNSRHLALDDIKDSINELIHYRKYFIDETS